MTEDRKQELIEKYRYIEVEDDFWHKDVIAEFFFDDLPDFYGADQRSAAFSGFWSQGDGASFEGDARISLTDGGLNLPIAAGISMKRDFPMVMRLLRLKDDGFIDVEYRRSGNHVHDATVTVSLYPYPESFELHAGYEGLSDLEIAAGEALDASLNEELDRLREDLQAHLRSKMRELYAALEKEYEYLTSDEYVWGTIQELGYDQEDNDVDSQCRVHTAGT